MLSMDGMGRRMTIADAGWGTNLLYGTVELHRGSNRWSQLFAVFPGPAVPSNASVQGTEAGVGRVALGVIADRPLESLYARVLQYPWLFLDSSDYLPVRMYVEHRRYGLPLVPFTIMF